MKINIIAACDKNGIIGVNGKIPWHIPEDMKRFKALTMGHAVIVGRKTWEGLPIKPLPGRKNIVISSTYAPEPNLVYQKADGSRFAVNSLDAALTYCRIHHTEVFIIGGEQLYREALPLADRVYLTLVNQETPIADGDEVARFPLDELIKSDMNVIENTHNDGYSFFEFART